MADFDFDNDVLAPVAAAPDETAAPDQPSEIPGYNPGQWDGYNENTPSVFGNAPAQQGPAQGAPQGTQAPVVTGASVSHKGIAGGPAVVDRLHSGVRAETAADMADYDAEQAGVKARYERDIGSEAAAVRDQASIEREHYAKEAELLDRQRDFQDLHAQLLDKIHANSKVEQAKYITAYKDQLAAVRTLAATSGNPLGSLSPTQGLALAAASFTQGFLGARGIHIDVANQVNQWVDRSMKEHQQMIENARQGAQDQLSLYELARQSSHDDIEARQRYTGMVIEGMKLGIQSEAGRFNSSMAAARGNEAIAKLQLHQDDVVAQMGERRRLAYQHYWTMHANEAHQNAQERIEEEKLSIMRAAAKAKAEKPAPVMPVFADPEGVVGSNGKPLKDANGNQFVHNRWRVKPGLPNEIATKVFEGANSAQTQYSDYLTATNKMMKSYAEAKSVIGNMKGGEVNWDLAARRDETGKIAKFLQDRSQWVMSKIYNDSGKQVNESEFDRHEALAYLDKEIARNGDKGEILNANLREAGRQKFENHMGAAGLEPIPETDPEYNGRRITASPRTGGEDTAIVDGEEPVHGLVATEASKVGAKDSEEAVSKKVSGTWLDFASNNKGGADIRSTPEYALAIEHIAAAYIRPNQMIHHSTAFGVSPDKEETPAEVRSGALETLKRLASGDSEGVKVNSTAAHYAQYMYDRLQGEPELAALKDSEEDYTDTDKSKFIKQLTGRY